jgi:hypothetical protein
MGDHSFFSVHLFAFAGIPCSSRSAGACPACAAWLKGKVSRPTCLDEVLTKSEAHQSEGGLILLYHFNIEMATAQFRFDTPTACGGELHFMLYSQKFQI